MPSLRLLLPLAAALGLSTGCQPPRPAAPLLAAPPPEPCENCPNDAPPPGLSDTLRMPPAEGERLVLVGTVTRGGRPVPGVALYVYHTDATGRYTPASNAAGLARAHGRLRGWLRTGPDGRYRVETIRPGAYPAHDDPQHVHLTVHPDGAPAFWIDDVVFADDPRLTATWVARQAGRGGSGVTHPVKDSAGVWHVVRDIDLDRR